MQRIKIFGGRITWTQWRKIAQLATSYSTGFPLHITTRQDVELHNIAPNSISAAQQGLAEVDLTTIAAGGDSIRNITLCTGCRFDPNLTDIYPLAKTLQQHLISIPDILNLPRKFKMSFSGCPTACAKPWLNDLGFISQGNRLLTVIGAGSLGPKPNLGIQLYTDLPANDILPLTVAAIELFEQCGDRENRRRARFRHIREKLGNEAFQAELDKRFRRVKARQSWPEVPFSSSNKNLKPLCRLQLPNGNICPADAVELADAAEPKAAELRVNLEHGLELYGTENFQLPQKLETLENNLIIVACPGTATCPKALANCWATANHIRYVLSGVYYPTIRINISGCPNNCAHSAVADIGLVGLLRKLNGKLTECYRLFTGGGNAKNDKLAEPYRIVSARNVPATIKRLLKASEPPNPTED